MSYTQVGNSENPPNSNVCSPYTDAWGAGAWCAMFVSWCDVQAGYPLPAINGPAGFSYVPSGQQYAYGNGESVGEAVENGDTLIFSWEPWHMEGGIALCSYGVYAGTPAGDHTGFFAGWLGGSYMRTVEGNTSHSSWDNGGAVMERTDRYTGQVCCYWRPAAIAAGGGGGGETDEMTEADWQRMAHLVNDTVIGVLRGQECYNMAVERSQFGAHYAVLGIVRSPEYDQIVQRSCMSALYNTGVAHQAGVAVASYDELNESIEQAAVDNPAEPEYQPVPAEPISG